MAVSIMERPAVRESRHSEPSKTHSVPSVPEGILIMYAIVFDMDTEKLKQNYPNASWQNAYGDVRDHLTGKHNFTWQQGSVYFGDPKLVNAVSTVLAIMDVARTFPWFGPSVRDVRMLRIEELNDLMGAVRQATE